MPTLKIYNSSTQQWEPVGTGVGMATYDMSHTPMGSGSGTSGVITVTFPANQRGTRMINSNDDTDLDVVCNNSSDNYIWIYNSSNSTIGVTIDSVTYNGVQLNPSDIHVAMETDLESGKIMEIGIICNADGAFITSRNDL